MLSRLLLPAAFLALTSAAFAQSGTPQEQAACRPDVRRFCHSVRQQDGDQAFLACLEMHRDRLTAACRGVLAGHGR